MTQQTQSGEERVMGEDRLHVVFGTGQVGSALAAHLAGQGRQSAPTASAAASPLRTAPSM
jgi:hypothetical protein